MTSQPATQDVNTGFLELTGINVSYRGRRGGLPGRGGPPVRAVDSASLRVDRGESLGLVGESGCGKSTLARVLLGLVRPAGGTVSVDGVDLLALSRRDLRAMRRRVQLVAQNPYDSLDPYMSVGDIVAEGIDIHRLATGPARDARIRALLEQVHLPAGYVTRRPHELSGGQRQRVAIARALAVEPEALVLDEPVSALDVSVQAQVLNLLNELAEARGLTYLFISHDMSVVRQVCTRIAVMYQGRIVETGPAADIIDRPEHPYTRTLMAAVPLPDPPG
ncbi:ATP-binding cassette domain-containing protein [Plantactinospora sp. GCM10030261]|uniref:ATP-binding cassette domain-containing protein n=1 Tax=Plantactinospora sp. GCM10030261 TaxID=3273420 RepID=UPI003609CBB2